MEDKSAKVKEMRKTLGLTCQEFAEAVGVTRMTVHRWEHGLVNIPGKSMDRAIYIYNQIINALK